MKTYKIPCKNCSGLGYIAKFKHIEGGVCFACDGSKIEYGTKEDYEDAVKKVKIEQQRKSKHYYVFNNGTLAKHHAKSLGDGVMLHEDYTFNGVNIMSMTTLRHGDDLKIKAWKESENDREIVKHLLSLRYENAIKRLRTDLEIEMEEEWKLKLHNMIGNYQELIKNIDKEAEKLILSCEN